jgi:hypothetical protein
VNSKQIVNTERQYYIDWLRIIGTITVFIFHIIRIFDTGQYYLKDEISQEITIIVLFTIQWMMPLFFIISGMSSFYSLGIRKPREYLYKRFKRLIIPFIFSVFVILPTVIYFERISTSVFTGSYIEFYPHYFDGLYELGGNFAWNGLHLWYLQFLFYFSVISLIPFIYFKQEKLKHIVTKISIFFTKPGAIYLLAIPLIIIEFYMSQLPGLLGSSKAGGWNIFIYFPFFVYGYIFATDPGYKKILEKYRYLSLILGIITSIMFLKINYVANYSIEYFIFVCIRCLSAWFLLMAIFGFSNRYLNFKNKFLKNANEAVLPFYILHMPIIIFVSFYTIKLDAPIIAKCIIIGVISFIIMIAVYKFMIKRFNILRFLFGIKTK